MNKRLPLLFLAIALLMLPVLTVASVNAASSQKILILTFDDGRKSAYTKVLPILDYYNVSATFFIVPNWVGTTPGLTHGESCMNWMEIRALKNAGHEIASHTVTHATLNETRLSEAQLIYELEKSKNFIYGNTSATVDSFAYPGGDYNLSVIAYVGKYYKFARTIDRGTARAGVNVPLVFNRDTLTNETILKLPAEFWFDNSTTSDSPYPGTAQAKKHIDDLVASSTGNTLIFCIHTVIDDDDYNASWTFDQYQNANKGTVPIAEQHLREIIEYALNKGVKITTLRNALYSRWSTLASQESVFSILPAILALVMMSIALPMIKKATEGYK